MERTKALKSKRDSLVKELDRYRNAISGNLSQGCVPPGSGNYYWRITWKEKQKTRILYVREEELPIIRKGIRQFARLKETMQKIGDANRTLIFLERAKKKQRSLR